MTLTSRFRVADMALSAFSFSLMGLFVKLAGQRLPSQEIVAFRALFTLTLTLILLRSAGIGVWGKARGWLLLRGFFGFCGLSCFYFAVVHLPLAEATVIQYTNPIFTALLAALFLGERVGRGLWAALGLGFVGVLLIARPAMLFGGAAAPYSPWVVAVAFLGALTAACAYVLVRKLSRGEHELVIIFYFPLVALPGSLPAVWFVDPVWPAGWDWLWLLGVGITAQLAQIWLTRGIGRIPAGHATVMLYLQIVFAALWGALFLDEIPDRWTVAGALLILGGTLAAARARAATDGVPGNEHRERS